MWILQSTTGDETYHLLTGREYTVGRKDADIVIPGDMSVSRAHAVISVLHSEANLGNPSKLATLKLQEKSKFGSLLNNEQIMGQNRELKDGDIIKFGTQKSLFRVMHEDFVITTSCLNAEGKHHVRSLMLKLGGHVTNDWQTGTRFLVMNNISVTVKVICALVSQKPIVTPNYLQQYVTALSSKKQMPDPKNFQPELSEAQLNPSEVSFLPDEKRGTLFQGKIFVFLSPKQFKKLGQAIELAGGMLMLLEESGDLDEMLTQPGSCVMHCEAADTKSAAWYTTVTKLLKKNKRRMIPDAEIGYAVLYCSVAQYCNPEESTAIIPGLPSQSLSQQRPDSEQQPSQVVPRIDERKKITRESVAPEQKVKENPCTQGSPRLGKRARNEYGETTGLMNPPKQIKLSQRTVKKETTTPQGKKCTNIFEDSDETNIDQSGPPEPKTKKLFSPVPDTEMVSPDQSKQHPVDVTTNVVYESIIKTPEEAIQSNKARVSSPKKNSASNFIRQSPVVTRSRSPSPVPGGLREYKMSPQGDNHSRSPSPVPGQRKKTRGPASHNNDTGNSRVKSERRSNSKSPSPTPEVTTRRTGRRGKVMDTVSQSASPVHAGKTQQMPYVQDSSADSRSFSPGPSRGPKRRRKENSDMSDEGVDTKLSARSVSPDASDTSGMGIEILKKSPPTPKITSGKISNGMSAGGSKDSTHANVQASLAFVKQEADPDVKPRMGFLQNGAVTDGYLTTVAPISDQVAPNKEYLEEDQPQQLVQTKFTSLMARKPGEKKSASAVTIENGYTVWNGRRVRNFKKFSKTKNIGGGGLPTIIGGKDLEVHRNKTNKDLDDWVRDAMEAESQQSKQELLARELFDFAPRKATKGRRL